MSHLIWIFKHRLHWCIIIIIFGMQTVWFSLLAATVYAYMNSDLYRLLGQQYTRLLLSFTDFHSHFFIPLYNILLYSLSLSLFLLTLYWVFKRFTVDGPKANCTQVSCFFSYSIRAMALLQIHCVQRLLISFWCFSNCWVSVADTTTTTRRGKKEEKEKSTGSVRCPFSIAGELTRP